MSVHRGYSYVANWPRKGSEVVTPNGRVGKVSKMLRAANRGWCEVEYSDAAYPHTSTHLVRGLASLAVICGDRIEMFGCVCTFPKGHKNSTDPLTQLCGIRGNGRSTK